MRKPDMNKYPYGTAEYVVLHAKWRKSKGKASSATFCFKRNPRKALKLAEKLAYFPPSGEYLDGKVPEFYRCSKCGASNCKLWRDYGSCEKLLCAHCAALNQKKQIDDIDKEGCRTTEHGRTDQIGWYLPAVPIEHAQAYWDYQAVPNPAADWWRNLPTLPDTTSK